MGQLRGCIPRTVEDVLSIIRNTFASDSLDDFGTLPKDRQDPDTVSDRVYLKMSSYLVYCE